MLVTVHHIFRVKEAAKHQNMSEESEASKVESDAPAMAAQVKANPALCPFCNKKFAGKNELVEHKNDVHLKLKPMTCSICNNFSTYGEHKLIIHLITIHAEVMESMEAQLSMGILVCPCCKAVFKRKLALKVHILENHALDGPRKCKNAGCSSGFWTFKDDQAHKETCAHKPVEVAPKIRVISAAKITEAEGDSGPDYSAIMDCEEEQSPPKLVIEKVAQRELVFGEKISEVHADHGHFLTGFKSFKADNFECCECGSQFDSGDLLLNHLDQHEVMDKSPYKKDPTKQCILCDFVPKSTLNADERRKQMSDHVIASHFMAMLPDIKAPEGEKKAIKVQIKCKVCYREFEKESFLRIHMKYHHNSDSESLKQLEAMNKCSRCSKTCLSESQLMLHVSLYCDVTFGCDYCAQVFNKIQVLAKHIKSVHKFAQLVAGSKESNGEKTDDDANLEDSEVPEKLRKIEYDECPFCDAIVAKLPSHQQRPTGARPHQDQTSILCRRHRQLSRLRFLHGKR